jgi:hypothetical protein
MQLKSVERRIHKIREALRATEQALLGDNVRRGKLRPQAALEGEAFLRETVELVLAQVGRGVASAVRIWTSDAGRKTSDEAINIYFWPGYERIAGEVGRARGKADEPDEISFKRLKGDLKVTELRFGYGSEGRPTWTLDSNSYWFNVALGQLIETESISALVPGSTHGWFRRYSDKSGKNLPDVLAVHLGKPSGRPGQLGIAGDPIHVWLTDNNPAGWGRQIRAAIQRNAQTRDPDRAWPDGVETADTNVRLAQYDIWLAACFRPETLSDDALLEDSLGSVLKSEEFVARWGQDAVEGYLNRYKTARRIWSKWYIEYTKVYRHWYTLPLTEPIGSAVVAQGPGSDAISQPYLGTVMFLCSIEIPSICLGIISSWVRGMYLQIRQIEAQILAMNQASAKLANAFEHEVAKHGTALLSRFNQPLRDVLEWEDSPLRVLNDGAGSGQQQDITRHIDGWQIVTVPELYDGLRDMFSLWGSPNLSIKPWYITFPLSLEGLIGALRDKARAVAAARKVEESAAPMSLKESMGLRNNYRDHLGDRPIFVTSPKNCVVQFALSASRDDQIFLVRLNLALMANVAFHALEKSEVEVLWHAETQREEDGIRVKFRNRISGFVDTEKLARTDYFMNTFAVAELCAQRLGGHVDNPDVREGVFETSYFLPLKSSFKSKASWISIESEVADANHLDRG